MTMPMSYTLMDASVLAVVVFAVIFLAAWLARPDLRAWVERPKYRFQADVQNYDRMAKRGRDE